MLEVSLRHDFPDFALKAEVSAPAGVTVFFGRSGAGKTSFVKAVAGLLKVDFARVTVGDEVLEDTKIGHRLPPHRRGVGYVFQEPRLFPHLSVRANLTYARSGAPVAPVVEMLGIGDLLDRRPGALSGGEAQRVAIGRALLSQPRLLLLDEPLAALDDARKAEILPYIERLRDEAKVPILYVSHSIAEVARLATTIVAMEAGQVRRVGPTADILSDPDMAPVIGVREAGSVLDARVVAHHADGLSELSAAGGTLWLPQVAAEVGQQMRVRVEAQDVMLAKTRPEGISALNVLEVTVAEVRAGQGPGAMVQLQADDARILARVTRRSAEALGLVTGWRGFAVVKSVSVAAGDVSAR